MKSTVRITRGFALAGLAAVLIPAAGVSAISAASTQPSASATKQTVAEVIAKGDQEITRRLSSLNGLTTKITSATKLSSADKATLSNEVTSEISGLTALKTKLDAETTLAGAHADAQTIYTGYRVYALTTPKVWLVKTADDQQILEGKLTTMTSKLQTRLNTAKASGKAVASLQALLDDMTSKTVAAQNISSAIEQKVIGLQPGDYNSDHTILSGDRDQLNTAATNDKAAVADAKQIVAGIKSL